jgi:hypothetical protein
MRTSIGKAETFVEDRDEHRAAADPEHAGKESRQRAYCDQQQRQLDQFGEVKPRDGQDVSSARTKRS